MKGNSKIKEKFFKKILTEIRKTYFLAPKLGVDLYTGKYGSCYGQLWVPPETFCNAIVMKRASGTWCSFVLPAYLLTSPKYLQILFSSNKVLPKTEFIPDC